MSKPSSGHFIGTAGSNSTFKNLSQKDYKSGIILPKGIDTQLDSDSAEGYLKWTTSKV